MRRVLKVWAILGLLGFGAVSCQQGGNTQALETQIKTLETQVQTLQKEVETLKSQVASLQSEGAKTQTTKKSAKEKQGVKPRPPKKKSG